MDPNSKLEINNIHNSEFIFETIVRPGIQGKEEVQSENILLSGGGAEEQVPKTNVKLVINIIGGILLASLVLSLRKDIKNRSSYSGF
ncbi:hypothetical protein RH915_11100 [Serpentinicella sp. ANB-PHB4]|uniref:hypothetical protein n=1 Tax=Serpentinicella sp. ANB-PHB4 TaxID=3074076 RepID=UPI002857483E|nr:hypothetical protein [Serpentinicella sp. ANB-PHB4]MDR5660037.1 hypothetical protein [Serpentinicella sp. ANB-PHB4]